MVAWKQYLKSFASFFELSIAPKKAADEAAAAKKAADEAAAAKKAADEAAAAKKAADEAAAALAAENSDRKADNAVLRPTPTGSDLLKKSSVGAKNVVKNDSNLTTNYSSAQDSTSNTPELMNVQDPEKGLETLVVGQDLDKKDSKVKVTYLGGLKSLATAKLDAGKLEITKTDGEVAVIKGGDKALVYTVQDKRKNYTENYGGKIADPEKKTVADPADTDKLRKPDHTSIVGQMYGAKITDGKTADATTNKPTNAPFTNKPYENVQYGSLTSALHAKDISELLPGKLDGKTVEDAKIAEYGYTGTIGTEDNYFYRLNKDNMDADELVKLKNANPNTVLKYDGHAVTYGIDNNWKGSQAKFGTSGGVPRPTAVHPSEATVEASDSGLVSGTHVTAKINLNTNAVEGNLYNKWYDGALKDVKDVRLVEFTGSMSDNGNIAGTSHNNINNTAGLFGASLNKDASEMGGVVSSNDHTAEGKWGAVFGAQLTGREDTIVSPNPATKPSINSSGNAK